MKDEMALSRMRAADRSADVEKRSETEYNGGNGGNGEGGGGEIVANAGTRD